MTAGDAKRGSLASLWKESMASIRLNLVAGLVLWAIGAAVVATYYLAEDARGFFDSISALKIRFGFLYSGVATAIFGGLLPFFGLWILKQIPTGTHRSLLVFLVVFWAIKGIEVDALYRLQAWIFGNGTDFATIAAKVAVDQFVYCPFWSAPVTAIWYLWKDLGFSFGRLRERFRWGDFVFDVARVLLSTWIVWIPGTAIIYSLPLPLQIPLFNLVLCFFVMIVSVLSRERGCGENASEH